MANTLWHAAAGAEAATQDKTGAKARPVAWQKKMSDHIAFGLLVYTGLHIFVTMEAIKGTQGSILPYFGLVLLVAAIIPACRKLEDRWKRLSDSGIEDAALRPIFARDRIGVWLCAVGLPFALTGLYGLIA